MSQILFPIQEKHAKLSVENKGKTIEEIYANIIRQERHKHKYLMRNKVFLFIQKLSNKGRLSVMLIISKRIVIMKFCFKSVRLQF